MGHRHDKAWLFALSRSMPKPSPVQSEPPPSNEQREAKFKWQDWVGFIGALLSVVGMSDMPLMLRLFCLGVCSITGPLSFSSHKNWHLRNRVLASAAVVALMATIAWFAVHHPEQKILSKEDLKSLFDDEFNKHLPKKAEEDQKPNRTSTPKPPVGDLILFAYNGTDKGSVVNNSDSSIFVTTITASTLNGVKKTGSSAFNLNLSLPPHSQPVVFSIPIQPGTAPPVQPGTGMLLWDTLPTYKSANFWDAFNDAYKKYKPCLSVAVFSVDEHELKQFQEYYSSISKPFPVGEGLIEVNYEKDGRPLLASFRGKTAILLMHGCNPTADTTEH